MKVRKNNQVAVVSQSSGVKAAAKPSSPVWRFLFDSMPDETKPLSSWHYLGLLGMAVFCLAASVYCWWAEEFVFEGVTYHGTAALAFCLSLFSAGMGFGLPTMVRACWQWPQSAERLGFSCTLARGKRLQRWGISLLLVSVPLFAAALWMAEEHLQAVSCLAGIYLSLIVWYGHWKRTHANS